MNIIILGMVTATLFIFIKSVINWLRYDKCIYMAHSITGAIKVFPDLESLHKFWSQHRMLCVMAVRHKGSTYVWTSINRDWIKALD